MGFCTLLSAGFFYIFLVSLLFAVFEKSKHDRDDDDDDTMMTLLR